MGALVGVAVTAVIGIVALGVAWVPGAETHDARIKSTDTMKAVRILSLALVVLDIHNFDGPNRQRGVIQISGALPVEAYFESRPD